MSCSAPSLSLPFFHPPPALQPDVVDVRATAPADAAETGVCCSRHCPQFRCLSLLSVRPLLTTWYVHLLLSVTLQRRRRLQGTDGSCIDARRWAPRCVLAMAPCTRRRARGDERANTAPPAPRALRHRRRRSRRSSRVRRAKTGSPQRSATTRKVAEALGTRLSTRADPFAREDITPLTSSPLVMSSPCSPPLTRIRPSKSTPTRPLTPQHPSPSDPPPRRRHAAPRRLFLDPISGRSTASKGECTSEMQRSQRAAGRRGIWVMPGDVLLASRRYPTSTAQPTHTACAARRRHHGHESPQVSDVPCTPRGDREDALACLSHARCPGDDHRAHINDDNTHAPPPRKAPWPAYLRSRFDAAGRVIGTRNCAGKPALVFELATSAVTFNNQGQHILHEEGPA